MQGAKPGAMVMDHSHDFELTPDGGFIAAAHGQADSDESGRRHKKRSAQIMAELPTNSFPCAKRSHGISWPAWTFIKSQVSTNVGKQLLATQNILKTFHPAAIIEASKHQSREKKAFNGYNHQGRAPESSVAR
jgi:hypothetical protein